MEISRRYRFHVGPGVPIGIVGERLPGIAGLPARRSDAFMDGHGFKSGPDAGMMAAATCDGK